MKKIISLVLSMVMVLALFTVGTNAVTFSDGATITPDYKEAVNVMAALGVLKGNEDRSFAPRNTLTRAEAAKIITYLLLGSESADKLTNDTPVFDDVPANFWGAPYIAFCVSEGIIDGNGDGTFTPDGKLTGFAFAKMLLGAIKFGGTYTGASWELSVLEDAKKSEKKSANGRGLLDVIEDIVLSDEITREKASQMAFNALFFSSKDNAEYGIVINNGDAAMEAAVKGKTFTDVKELNAFLKSCGLDSKDNYRDSIYSIVDVTETLAEENFEVLTLDGYVVRNSGMSLDEFTTVRDDRGVDHKFNLLTDTSSFGHYVTVYYKDEWTWEKGDTDDDLKGVTYTFVDRTIPVAMTKKSNMTEKELKDALGVKKLDTTAVKHYHYMYQYDYNTTYSPFTRNLDEPRNWDVVSGTALLREDENGERYIDGFSRESSKPVEFFITMIDADEEIYNVGTAPGGDDVVKMDADDPDDNYDKTIPDSYGNSIDWLDYIDNDDGIEKYNSAETGEVVLFDKCMGELHALSTIIKVVGKIEKVELRDHYDGDSYVTINGKRYPLPDSYSATSANKITYEKLAGGKAHFTIEGMGERRPRLSADLDMNKEYVFFIQSRVYAFAEVEYDSKLIIPTKFYAIDTFEKNTDIDDYGDDVDQEERYEYYVQGVNLNGEEVKLPVAWDYNTETGSLGNSAGTFLKAYGGSGKGYTEEGAPVNGKAGTPFASNEAAFRSIGATREGVKTYIPCIYAYTMEKDSNGKEYAHFTLAIGKDDTKYEDTNGVYSLEIVTQDLNLAKDTKRVNLDNSYLMGSEDYTVLTLNDADGKDLRIRTAENAYKQIGAFTVLYGEKDKNENTTKYTLKTAVNMKSSMTVASDNMIFVGTDFTDENISLVTYPDKNGRNKSVDAYEQYVFINGEGTWILTEEDNLVAGNLYEFEINEESGLYEKFRRYTGDDWYTDIGKMENNYGLISFGDIDDLRDSDVSDATVINTTDYNIKKNLASLAEDEKHNYCVAVKLDDSGDVETVYVYGIYTVLDIKFEGDVVEQGAALHIGAGNDAVFSFKDKNSAQGIVAVATKNGITYKPVVDTGSKTLTFENLEGGSYDVTITVTEADCGAQVLQFTLQVGGPV